MFLKPAEQKQHVCRIERSCQCFDICRTKDRRARIVAQTDHGQSCPGGAHQLGVSDHPAFVAKRQSLHLERGVFSF